MAPAAKANYKSFEAQARLIRAMVAAHPETKWNYKEIVACYGSDMTVDALNHRFRRFRAEATIIQEARKQGHDMKDLKMTNDLPATQGGVDKKNISKYFGQSTADGIQFQFRGIKKDAEKLRETANSGGDVANCPLPGINGSGGGVSSTTTTPTKTPRKAAGGRTGAGAKRKINIKEEFDSDGDEGDDSSPQDWSERDTPSKTASKRAKTGTPGQKNGTPSRRAASKAAATIAAVDATASLSESYSEPDAPSVAPSSIFGPPPGSSSAFARGGMDSLIGGNEFDTPYGVGLFGRNYGVDDLGGDGEI